MNERTPKLTMKDINKQIRLPDLSAKDTKSDDMLDHSKDDRAFLSPTESNLQKVEDKENMEIDNDDEIKIIDQSSQIKDNFIPSEMIKKKKSSEYIENRGNRIKSYVRRRPIPLRRVEEIDTQCGTKSFMCQVSLEFGEVIYTGHHELIKHFKSSSGLKLSDVNNILVSDRYQARPKGTKQNWEHDYNPAPESDREDEDFFQSLKARREAEAAKQVAKKSGDVEYIKNGTERLKKCKVYREGIFSKLREIDQLTGSMSFVIVLCSEREASYYYAHPNLVSLFFTSGLKYHELIKEFNVRKYELNEELFNMCSVPNCVVSRNTAARWRQIAIDKFRFPVQLPVNLHPCPDEERDKWMAEIDLDPNFKAKVVACSFHFKDGYPSVENPYPSQFLGGLNQSPYFSGKVPELDNSEENESKIMHEFCASWIETCVMKEVENQIEIIQARIEMEEKRRKEREEQRRKDKLHMKTIHFYKFSRINDSMKPKRSIFRKKKRKSLTDLRGRKAQRDNSTAVQKPVDVLRRILVKRRKLRMNKLRCKYCPSSHSYTKYLFNHVRNVHVAPVRRKIETEVIVSDKDRLTLMNALYPKTLSQNPNKKYICAVCKTVTTLTGLFLHMNEVHNGILCQYCLKLFKRVRDLEIHLENIHRRTTRYYSSMELFKKYSGNQMTMVCYDCGTCLLVSEAEHHNCSSVSRFTCPYCGEDFRSQDDIELHICGDDCPVSKISTVYHKQQNTKLDDREKDKIYKTQVAYKVLTGKNLVLESQEKTSDYPEMDINSMLQVSIADTSREQRPMVTPKEPQPRNAYFNPFDRNAYQFAKTTPESVMFVSSLVLKNVPCSGQIFSGTKSKGLSNNVKREFKDRGHSFFITKEVEDSACDKSDTNVDSESLIDTAIKDLRIERAGKNFIIDDSKRRRTSLDEDVDSDTEDADEIPDLETLDDDQDNVPSLPKIAQRPASKRTVKPTMRIQGATQPTLHLADKTESPPSMSTVPKTAEKVKVESRAERIARMETEIRNNVSKMRRVIDKFVNCLFCQQCKTVSVDVSFLLSHFHIHHLADGVNNLMEETAQHCITRIKKYLKDTRRKEILFDYCPRDELFVLEFYRCSYCPTTECKQYSDLFKHTETAHQTKILTCNICHNIFLNYGSLISHVCTGPPTSAATRARFACKICRRVDLHSFLEFQSHIRKEHNICEICFTSENNQADLYKHCTAHDQDLMCMKCFVTFEKSISFRKHLFLKHSAEQSECASCHSPTWPHVYHFCLPENSVPCHNCEAVLPNAAAFKVHLRVHKGSTPHVCDQLNCNRSYISKSLLWKHQVRRHPQLKPSIEQLLRRRKLKKDVDKYGASDVDSLDISQQIVDLLWEGVSKKIEELEPSPPESPEPEPEVEMKPDTPEATETSVLDAAIRSIMPESEDESRPIDTSALQETDRDAVQSTIAEKAYTEDNSWQAGIDALLAGASMKLPKLPVPSDQPPDQLFQNTDHEEGGGPVKSSDEAGSPAAPVIGGLWNQDLLLIGGEKSSPPQRNKGSRVRGGLSTRGGHHTELYSPQRPAGSGPRVRGRGARTLAPRSIRTNFTAAPPKKSEFDLNLSESSDDDDGGDERKQREQINMGALIRPLLDHDYCYVAYMMSQEPPEDTTEMDKIVSNVTFDRFGDSFEHSYVSPKSVEKLRHKSKGQDSCNSSDTSSADELPEKVSKDVDIFGMAARSQMINTSLPAQPSGFDASTPALFDKAKHSSTAVQFHNQVTSTPAIQGRDPLLGDDPNFMDASPAVTPFLKRGPKPKYHTPDVSKFSGVTAGTARPSFDTDSSKGSDSEDESEDEEASSEDDINSSDLDTDFSADESVPATGDSRRGKAKSTTKSKPNIKLKIKLPPQKSKEKSTRQGKKSKKRRKSQPEEEDAKPLSKKMRESLALNQRLASSEEDEDEADSSDDDARHNRDVTARSLTKGAAGGDEGAVEDTKLYCYCQCPHDEYSEMIGCDAPDCRLEWFHFECVNILVPPEGKWYCPECTKRYGLG